MEFGVVADAYRSDSSNRSSRLGAIALQGAFAGIAFILVLFISEFAVGTISLVVLVVATIIALIVLSSVHVALDWERYVVLRFGQFNRLGGPGVFFTIPLVEYCTLRVDQRTLITPFGAEETLTSDVVPIDVDAVLSWMIWDPEKACVEVEDCHFAVALAAQTALRDAVGRATASEVIMRREQLDKQLKDVIDEKVSKWGATVFSVEIRNIIIPFELQKAMSLEAQAERRCQARVMLMESERDIAELLNEAADIYSKNSLAYDLRKMHLVNEGMQDGDESVVIPTSYAEGFAGKGFSDQQ